MTDNIFKTEPTKKHILKAKVPQLMKKWKLKCDCLIQQDKYLNVAPNEP